MKNQMTQHAIHIRIENSEYIQDDLDNLRENIDANHLTETGSQADNIPHYALKVFGNVPSNKSLKKLSPKYSHSRSDRFLDVLNNDLITSSPTSSRPPRNLSKAVILPNRIDSMVKL